MLFLPVKALPSVTASKINPVRQGSRGLPRPLSAPGQGFSLTELLVVIAVLALLAALLLSALAGAKRSAKSVVCKNNLCQLVIGLSLYEVDHELYPGFMDGVVFTKVELWATRLEPYVQSGWFTQLYRCPAYEGETGLPAPGVTISPWHFGSYGYNAHGTAVGPGGGGGSIDHLQIGLGTGSGGAPVSKNYLVGTSQINATSEMMALGDATLTPSGNDDKPTGLGLFQYSFGWDFSVWRGDKVSWPNVPIDKTTRRRHTGGAFNVAFCDGHLEALKWDDLFKAKTNLHRARWNRDNEPHYETYPRGG